MENFQVYRDIQARTGGDIYIGVVGPVRTGKSTFIRRFMEQLALPAMSGGAAGRGKEISSFKWFRKADHNSGTKVYSKRGGSGYSGRGSEGSDPSDRLCRLFG